MYSNILKKLGGIKITDKDWRDKILVALAKFNNKHRGQEMQIGELRRQLEINSEVLGDILLDLIKLKYVVGRGGLHKDSSGVKIIIHGKLYLESQGLDY